MVPRQPKCRVEHAKKELRRAGASMRCEALAKVLESLDFVVEDGKKPGHKKLKHRRLSDISDFTASAYTCGHGKNPEVKPNYTQAILRLIKRYEAELKKILGESE